MIFDKHIINLNQAFLQAMDTYANKTCFFVKRGNRFQIITYRHFQKHTFRLAHFLRNEGLNKGERIVIIVDNPIKWLVLFIAGLLAGGVVVLLRASLPGDKIQAMIRDSQATLAIVQGEEQITLIRQAKDQLPNLRTIITINEPEATYPIATPISSIFASITTSAEEAELTYQANQVATQDIVSIYYKTSNVRGIVFNHQQRLASLRSIAEWLTVDEDDIAMTNAHSWSLSMLDVALYYFLKGVPHVLADEAELEAAQQTSPTIVLTTPSGFEKFYNFVLNDVKQKKQSRQAVFQWALGVGKEYRGAGLAASEQLREDYKEADRTFFNKIRGLFGGRIERFYSTGAPLPQQWAEFAEVVGIMPLNIYSQTEAGGFPAVSQPDSRRLGSCGQVAPGYQVRISDDGEILVRGDMSMQGYWQRPRETKEVLEADGWLHTGDLGRFDHDGYLYIVGHKQSPLLLSTGHRVMPAILKNLLTRSPFIHQAVILGENRPYVAALIVPDITNVRAYFNDNGHQTNLSPTHPTVKQLIDNIINEVNNQLDVWGRIKKYILLDKSLCKEDGELTPAGKICRDTVLERYADQIEALYPQTLYFDHQDVSEVKLSPAQLRELLEKQDILDAWMEDAGIGFLFDLARAKQIDPLSMVHICETVAAISQMQDEEKSLSTALIVGELGPLTRQLPESEIQLHRYDHIRRMRQIVVTMAKMVNGLVLGYVLDKHGYVRGIHKLSQCIHDENNFLLGPQFRHHAAISKQCDALVFLVPVGGGQVRIFADGQLVGRYADGSWSPENIPNIDEAVAHLAEEKALRLELLQRVMRCAFHMSENNLGAIFLIGNADHILEHSDPPEINSFATIVNADIDHLTDEELINFAKQDGATVIDSTGLFRGCMILLRPDASTQAEIGPGKGARHSSAAKMSAEAECIAITISQDGPITIYDCGRRVLSL